MQSQYQTQHYAGRANGRLASLDGLRGIAALGVGLIFHARIIVDPDLFANVPLLGWCQTYGWSLVDLFFTLSGFVFAHHYLEGSRMRPAITASDFIVARIARLWPLHLVTLIYVAFILRDWAGTTAANIALSAVFAHVFIEDPLAVLNGPAWSLSVEAICYGIFAVAAFAGGRWLHSIAVISILVGIGAIWTFGNWEALIGRGLAGFFIGLLLCRASSVLARVPTWALLPGALLPFVLPPEGRALIATILVAWPCAILLALRTRPLASRFFTWLGDRSYTIYMVHVPIFFVINDVIGHVDGGSVGLSMLALLVSWTVILVVSDILYRTLERPAQKSILAFYREAKTLPLASRISP